MGGASGGAVRAHRRQFVVWSRAVSPAVDWVSAPIAPGRVLSHCPDLSVAHGRDADGAEWAVLGTAICLDPAFATPVGHLAATATRDVSEAIRDWTGRWLLLGADAIHTDATAQIGVLHGRADDGSLVVTSSPALGRTVGRAVAREVEDDRPARSGRALDWMPPPRTRFRGLRRLLPSQVLSPRDGAVVHRPFLRAVGPDDVEGHLDAIVASLSLALTRLAATHAPLHFGLSAGRDSRTILAVAATAGVPLLPFTRTGPKVSVADQVLAARIAALAGLPHRYLRDRPGDRGRMAMLRAHDGGTVAAGSVRPFLHGARDDLTGAMTNGGALGSVLGFSDWRSLPQALPEPERFADALCDLMDEPRDSPVRPGLIEWAAWARAHPEPGMDWRDRIYFEQRRCGWQAAKDQVFDMQTVRRIPVLNGARIWALIMALPEEMRRSGGVQDAIVARCCPSLARVPYNPPDRAFLLRRPDLVARGKAWRVARRLGLLRQRRAAGHPDGA